MNQKLLFVPAILLSIVLVQALPALATSGTPPESCEEANNDPSKEYGCGSYGDRCWVIHKETGMRVQLSSCDGDVIVLPPFGERESDYLP